MFAKMGNKWFGAIKLAAYIIVSSGATNENLLLKDVFEFRLAARTMVEAQPSTRPLYHSFRAH